MKAASTHHLAGQDCLVSVTREKSPVATFTPQCPLLSSICQSFCLFVRLHARLESCHPDLMTEKAWNNNSSVWIQESCWSWLVEAPFCFVLFPSRQAGRQGWSCFTVSSGCVPLLRSSGASHSLDASPGKGRVGEGRSGEPRAWRVSVSPHRARKWSSSNSAHAPMVREDPNLTSSLSECG